MKEKCAAEEGEKQNIQWSYEEELKALEEKWTVKLEDSERVGSYYFIYHFMTSGHISII